MGRCANPAPNVSACVSHLYLRMCVTASAAQARAAAPFSTIHDGLVVRLVSLRNDKEMHCYDVQNAMPHRCTSYGHNGLGYSKKRISLTSQWSTPFNGKHNGAHMVAQHGSRDAATVQRAERGWFNSAERRHRRNITMCARNDRSKRWDNDWSKEHDRYDDRGWSDDHNHSHHNDTWCWKFWSPQQA